MTPLPCLCASTRRASRALTRFYSDQMGSGIEPSQFLLLSVLNRKPGCPRGLLVEWLGLDKTTLSRALQVMGRNGWIRPAKANDARERGYQLTPSGRKVLAATEPKWKRAQDKVSGVMSPSEWESVWNALDLVTRAAAHLTSDSAKS